MKAKRRTHDPEFKARVALEAIRGIKPIQQIAKEYEVHPVQVSDWKRAMAKGAAEVFVPGGGRGKEENFDREREGLHAKIGELSVQVDFLRKKSKQLGL